MNNKEIWGRTLFKENFAKIKGKIKVWMHWERNEHKENEFKFIKGLFSFKMDLPPIQLRSQQICNYVSSKNYDLISTPMSVIHNLNFPSTHFHQ